MNRLADKVALITGSTGMGLGTEMASVFAAEGAKTVVTGRSVERGAAVVERIIEAGGDAHFVQADLTEGVAANALVRDVLDHYGHLDILVNNAVATIQGSDGPVGEVDPDVWERTFRVNVWGAFHLTRAALAPMVGGGRGSIVNIGSRTAIRGTPRLAAYSASKGALHALTRSIAVDYAAHNIRANTVSPGFITGKQRTGELAPDRRAWVEAMHLTHPPTVTEVSLAALYLASDEAASVTGIELLVDGGGSMVRGLTLG